MVHTYKYKDYFLALDVESGSVHVLSELAYDAINALNAGQPLSCLSKEATNSEINEVMAEIAELKKEGTLFSEMEYTPEDIKAFDPVAKALCLNVTTGCNLRCEYCFAGAGHVPHENMSFEVAKQGLEFLIENSKDRVNLEVDFFGGEPTLNFDVIKQTVEYGRKREAETGKKFRFTVTTNGYYVTDEMIDFFNAEMKNIVISMDGRKEIHDSIRLTAGGGASYDRVLETAKKIVESRGNKEYYIRGTYTKKNLDFSQDVIAMYDAGFKEVSIEPVVTSGELSLTEEDLPKIFAEYEALAAYLEENRKKRGLHFFHFTIDLSGGPCLNKRLRGCGAGVEYFAVNPDGNLYPCHQFAGDSEFVIGNVVDGLTHFELQKKFKDAHIYTKESCANCAVKYYCSGGCMANAYHANGDFNKPYKLECDMMKKRVELGIALSVLEEEND